MGEGEWRRLAPSAVFAKPGQTSVGGAGPSFALSEMRPLVALKLASLVQIALLASQQDYHPLLDAPPHLPGVRLRLFPSGISYLSQVVISKILVFAATSGALYFQRNNKISFWLEINVLMYPPSFFFLCHHPYLTSALPSLFRLLNPLAALLFAEGLIFRLLH